MQEIGKDLEKTIVVGLASPCLGKEESSSEDTLDEMEELVRTAGGDPIGRVLQSRRIPDSGTFIGEGKAEEIKDFIKENSVTLVAFDNNLSPSQAKNLEDIFGCRVIDRSGIILDIFVSSTPYSFESKS